MSAGTSDPELASGPRAFFRRRRDLLLPIELVKACRDDPHHFPERTILIAQDHFAQTSLDWAERMRSERSPDELRHLASKLSGEAASFARLNGALAGTPFLLALVPAYLSVLWEQARLVMRIGALAGRDPRTREFAAEMLVLRGLHDTTEKASAALEELDAHVKPTRRRVRARVAAWARLIFRVLVLAGFVSAPEKIDHTRTPLERVRQVLVVSFTIVIYWLTWVIPITFMIVMAYSCEHDTRTLARRTISHFEADASAPPGGWRAGTTNLGGLLHTSVRRIVFVVSVMVPLGLVALAVIDSDTFVRIAELAGYIGLIVVLALAGRQARN